MSLSRKIVQDDEPEPRPTVHVVSKSVQSAPAVSEASKDLAHRLDQIMRQNAALQRQITVLQSAHNALESELRETRDLRVTPSQQVEISAIETGNKLIVRIKNQEGITLESVRQALAGTATRQTENRFSPVRAWARQRAESQGRDVYGREPLTTDEPVLTWLSTPDSSGVTPYHKIRTVRGDAWRNLIRGWKPLRPFCP